MHRISVEKLIPKQEAESVFLVKYIAVAEAKDGKKYLNIIFTDKTGDLEGRSWNDAEEIAAMVSKGDFTKVKGKVNIFQGKKQFIVQSISVVDRNSVDLNEFIFKAPEDPENMYKELLSIVSSLEDIYIKDLLTLILNESEIQRRLKIWQAGKSIHHAYESGLLQHILSCAKLAVQLSPIYGVNTSYVVAGAILHDLCKIYELTSDFNVEYTEEGKLVGHLVKGGEILDRYTYKIKNFPYQMKLHLKHILLSHHGEYEYGSPKIPQTSEAMLVHLIDLMDSKMHSFATIKRTDNNVGHWSSYIKHLDRIVYKAELPTYTEYITEEKAIKPKKQKPVDRPLKGSMADALKGFKV